MFLYSLVLGSALVGAALDGAAAPYGPGTVPAVAVSDMAAADYPWSMAAQDSGPDLVGGLAGAAVVILCGGMLWFFDGTKAANATRSAPGSDQDVVRYDQGAGVARRRWNRV
jgi:hypothetical protein